MSSTDRAPYLTATALDQDLLNDCADNNSIDLRMVIEVSTGSQTLYVSSRDVYVGDIFYRTLTNLPTITRTVGEWLSSAFEFSVLEIEISNADGRFNDLLPGGANYDGWIDASVRVRIGLRDVVSTYFDVFNGFVVPEGGFQRGVASIALRSRDQWERINRSFPETVFTKSSFANIEDANVGLSLPVIYGDFTTALEGPADVPSFVVNGADPNVDGTSARNAVECVISENDLSFLDNTKVYLVRGTEFYAAPSGDVTVGLGNRSFTVAQDSGGTWVDGGPFEFASGDQFFVQVRGPDLGGFRDNIVAQAQDILQTIGGALAGDFDSSWTTYRDKATPAQSAIASIKSRIWVQEQQQTVEYCQQLFEQVRLEFFVTRENKIRINPIHFEDWEASPAFILRNADIEKGSYQPRISENTNFNRCQGQYNFSPRTGENLSRTSFFRNDAAITQVGRRLTKVIVFPNLYVESDVVNQVTEIVRLASTGSELVELSATWRTLLLDVGDFVRTRVDIGSISSDAPAMIRQIGYNPNGFKLQMRLWDFSLVPFPGHSPSGAGVVGGYLAAITEES